MKDEHFQVATSGSVFDSGELLLTQFAESVRTVAPRAEIVLPKFKPAMGAVFLALKEAGVELSEVIQT